MSRNNPLRGEQPPPNLPTLRTAHPDDIRGVTAAPDRYLRINVDLEWTDGHRETGHGYARAWTLSAVLVDVETSRGHYIAWVAAGQVTRRQPSV